MILAEIQYKTYNGKFLAIIKAFKTWRYYLKGCKYKLFILTNYNKVCQFIDIKNLSFKQVRWAQKLSQYHFQIDYRQSKANAATDVLSKFLQKNQDKKDELQAKNGQIFYCLQNSLINASLVGLSLLFFFLSHLHQVLIYGIYVLLQLRHF